MKTVGYRGGEREVFANFNDAAGFLWDIYSYEKIGRDSLVGGGNFKPVR